jgi:hypothetical protein
MGILQSTLTENPVATSVEAQQPSVPEVRPSPSLRPQQRSPQLHHHPTQQHFLQPPPAQRLLTLPVERSEEHMDFLAGRFLRRAAGIESMLDHGGSFNENVKYVIEAKIVRRPLAQRLRDFVKIRNFVVHQPDSLTLAEMQQAREIAETLFTEIQALLKVHNNKEITPSKMPLKHSR